MSDFGGMEELLQDFLTESSDMLSDVDNKLVELEKRPEDKTLLNDIFRGFHTIKGGAGFLNVEALVTLCHRTENLFDKLRNGEMKLSAEILDYILASTGVVREMFGDLSQKRQPNGAPQALLDALDAVLDGKMPSQMTAAAAAPTPEPEKVVVAQTVASSSAPITANGGEPDWDALYHGLLGTTPVATSAPTPVETPAMSQTSAPVLEQAVVRTPENTPPAQRALAPTLPSGGQQSTQQLTTQETTIRIDTNRLDQVLNLSGEIGLTKNRLTTLRTDILQGKNDQLTLRSLDEAIGQLDLLVSDLQNAVMKTRMQPIGRLFQKYPRLARDLARQLGKDVELVITGEETELDKTMIEDLNDPLVHLVRNAVDHGIETKEDRLILGKSEKSLVQLSATQVGDHILIEITDDGKGMKPEMIRQKAIEKGLLRAEDANNLDDKQSLQLIFLPGFSTKDQISSVSGRGVGMDVVKTNIQKMNGRIDINSVPGEGTRFTISLPLTLAILPVLVVRVCDQPFAVPLAMVREIIPLAKNDIQQVSGKATMVVRDEILSVRSLAALIGWHDNKPPSFGVLMQSAETSFVLAIDSFVGRDDVVIKPLQNIKPKGIAGATLSGDGSVVLVLDMEDLLTALGTDQAAPLFDFAS
ncbi:chemotaxis protein CheA [Leeia sp. TBRC 13508]|uniref:histidine kinase n=1 Tax=Leeia speluncae TaxID=2884804 RepID=A0ABS8D8Y7_9NEIS|nr:chemotaxis protein CheA [Leeia speluncae]MCB6184406.1 chemotaxis protein CheA [Leeia speluncae]